MPVTSFDGRAFATFVAAGTYFLRKYRGVVDGLNVFPVPDGDTGQNMYLTARAALRGARSARGESLATVAQATADASLLGARGNSGVILSQMLRGFAHSVRHRDAIDTFGAALALRGAIAAARGALMRPVDGTMITVAERTADEAYALSRHEPDFVRFGAALVRVANDALERTPEQLPVLQEAGVVDAGAAGWCYFIEGALRFVPDAALRVTAFPRRPVRSKVFGAHQRVGERRYCAELVLENSTIAPHALRELLEPGGDSLIVAGASPLLKIHLHTADPDAALEIAARFGTPARVKVEDMAQQHHLLVVEPPPKPFGIATVVPGAGFERIARELGADVTIPVRSGVRASVEELVIGVNASLAERVYLLPNDRELFPAARAAAQSAAKSVVVIPTQDAVAGLAVQLALAGSADVSPDVLDATLGRVRTAKVDRQRLGARSTGDALAEVVRSLEPGDGSLVTLYYGGRQRERDARRAAVRLAQRTGTTVEYYYGGQPDAEYWVSVET